MSIKKIPTIKLTKFGGDPSEDFDRWKDHFERVVGRHVTMDKVAKLAYLEDSLTGEAKKHIGGYIQGLKKEDAYDRALAVLERIYGGEIKRQNKAQHRFQRMEPLKSLSGKELTRVYLGVCNLVDFHTDNNHQYILNNSGNADYRDCRKKLGGFITEYDLWAIKENEPHTILSLQKYLERMHKAALLRATIDSSDSEEEDDGVVNYGSRDQRGKDRGRGRRSYQPERRKDQEDGPRRRHWSSPNRNKKGTYKCSICSESHKLFKCNEFRKLSPKERLEHVKKEDICQICLEARHQKSRCPKKEFKCRKDDCKGQHNNLLHFQRGDQKDQKKAFKATNADKSEEASEEEKPADGMSNHANHSRSSRVAIQIGEVNIHVNGETHPGNILLDLGSDHTNIREDTANQYQMKVIKGPEQRTLSVMGERKSPLTLPN